MDDGSRLPWVLAAVLVLFAAYCAVAETAFASASRPKLKVAAEAGNKDAQKALNITDCFDKAITTILICTNIAHLSVASLVTVAVTK